MVADGENSWNQNTVPLGQKWGHVKTTLGPPWSLCLRSPMVLLIRAQALKGIASPFHLLCYLFLEREIYLSQLGECWNVPVFNDLGVDWQEIHRMKQRAWATFCDKHKRPGGWLCSGAVRKQPAVGSCDLVLFPSSLFLTPGFSSATQACAIIWPVKWKMGGFNVLNLMTTGTNLQ